MSNSKIFNLLATAIILKEPFKEDEAPKYLIMQRADHEKTFHGKWTVPGGKIETDDYTGLPRETEHYWYNVLEKALKREVKEEANIEIKNVWYLTSLARLTDKEEGLLVLSFVADFAGGDVALEENMQDSAWVTFEEAKDYKLMDGILDELYMAERKLAGEKDIEWERAK